MLFRIPYIVIDKNGVLILSVVVKFCLTVLLQFDLCLSMSTTRISDNLHNVKLGFRAFIGFSYLS